MILDPTGWQLYFTFLAGYTAAALLTATYDLLAPADRLEQFKTAARRRSDILAVYWRAAPLTAVNVLLTVFVGVVLLRPLIQPFDQFRYAELWKLPLLYVLADACFYIAHRTLHSGLLFNRVHRIHHRFTEPVGMAALYAHPLEVLVGNMLSVMLPPILLGASMPMYQFWIVMSIFNTVVVSHAGIKHVSEYHDLHHQRFDVNYGAEAGLMDRLCRTYRRTGTTAQTRARHAGA